jgi:hypothetical protein
VDSEIDDMKNQGTAKDLILASLDPETTGFMVRWHFSDSQTRGTSVLAAACAQQQGCASRSPAAEGGVLFLHYVASKPGFPTFLEILWPTQYPLIKKFSASVNQS